MADASDSGVQMTPAERAAAHARVFQMFDDIKAGEKAALAEAQAPLGEVGLSTNDEAIVAELEDEVLAQHMAAARQDRARRQEETKGAPKLSDVHALLGQGAQAYEKAQRRADAVVDQIPQIGDVLDAMAKAADAVRNGGVSGFFRVDRPLYPSVRGDPGLQAFLEGVEQKAVQNKTIVDAVAGVVKAVVKGAKESNQKLKKAMGLLLSRVEALENELRASENVALLAVRQAAAAQKAADQEAAARWAAENAAE